MRLALLAVLAVVGVLLMAVGVALVYPPASLIFVGAVCAGLALVVEVRDS